jgi:preprotein translocase SecE subunit
LVVMTLARGLEWVWMQMAWEDYSILTRQFRLTTLIAVLLGVGSAVAVYLHPVTSALSQEVVEELRKVSWPARDELTAATVVVIIAVFIFAAFLGAFDAIFLWITNLLLDIPADVTV